VGVGLVTLAIAAIIIVGNSQPEATVTPVTDPVVTVEPNPRPQANFNEMGDPNAPVTIIEYSDYQCPYCGQFVANTEPQLEEQYIKTGKVRFIYRSMGNFVSDNINRGTGGNNNESLLAAQAAYCAGDQGKYWEYHDILFGNQFGENEGYYARERLDAYAEAIGLDAKPFAECMDSKKYEDKANQDQKDGTKAMMDSPDNTDGGIATPTFFINGKMLMGAQPFETFQQEIEAALAAAQ
jgi:protein-disulfide isomerase